MTLEDKFLNFLNVIFLKNTHNLNIFNDDFQIIPENNLNCKKYKTLLAVSGGVDSIVMLHLFYKLNLNFGIAHCNFKLREEESDIDQSFISDYAKKLNLNFHTIDFDTKNYVINNKSIQMIARELRYEWFQKIAKQNKYDFIATAHHHNDNIETVLYNFIKGGGISGIKGILSKTNNIIRPLLSFTKNEILEYAIENNLNWREDITNKENKYKRNFLRNNVVPSLKKINPNLEKTIFRNIEKFKQVDCFIKDKITEYKLKYLKKYDTFYILDTTFLKNKDWGLLIISKIIDAYGFNYFQSEFIFQNINSKGKIFLSKKFKIIIDNNKIYIYPLALDQKTDHIIVQDQELLKVNNHIIRFKSINKMGYNLKLNSKITAIDKDKLKFPLKIRSWQQGDKFQPLGMTNYKKLSDFFIDNKISLFNKKNILVLISNDEIISILGHRISEKYKITKDTSNIYEVSFQ